MNKNFVKLKVKHSLKGIPSDKLLIEGDVSCVYSLNLQAQEQLFSCFDFNLKEVCYPKLVVIRKDFLPHIHLDCVSGINFYLKTSNEITTFYNDDASNQYENIGGETYKLVNNFNVIDSFTAQTGEVYVFNPRIPHAVSSPNNETRVFVSLTTQMPFAELCELTKDYWE